MTTQQQITIERHMRTYSGGEPIMVEEHGVTLCVLSTELGCFRIFRKYGYSGKCRMEYSENTKSWVFSLTLPEGLN